MGDFNPQDLANTAWAFATVSHKDEGLFTALAAAAERHMGDFNLQELANTAWAFAMSDRPAPALLDPILVLDSMTAQGDKPQVIYY